MFSRQNFRYRHRNSIKHDLPSSTTKEILKHRDPLFLLPNSDFSPDSGEFENLKKEKFNFEIEPMFQEYQASLETKKF